MEPKQNIKIAANRLCSSKERILDWLEKQDLSVKYSGTELFFGHRVARQLYGLDLATKSISFQIVKGGTGKTTLAYETAMASSLYGLRVLCIDLDQQANLSMSFGIKTNNTPTMADVLLGKSAIEQSIIEVSPGVSLVPSSIENSVLDDIIGFNSIELDTAYLKQVARVKHNYDLIIFDCPPNIGRSNTACMLAVDEVVIPVIPEVYAFAGLEKMHDFIEEINKDFDRDIKYKIALNKFAQTSSLSLRFHNELNIDPRYNNNTLNTSIRVSDDFQESLITKSSIFCRTNSSLAMQDLDAFAIELLELDFHKNNKFSESLSSKIF